MPIALELVDRGRLLSARLADHVRERADKLGHFCTGVEQCRVTVDGPGQHTLQGRFRVRISITVPGSEITINRQTGEDLPMAIRESFDAADQRLEDYVRIRRDSAESAQRESRKQQGGPGDPS